MANKNYQRGYATEYKILKQFREEGIYGQRSPASKGMFDVIGIDKTGVYLIQAKRTKKKKITPSMYRDEIQEIQQFVRSIPFPIPKFVKFQFWIWLDRQGWLKYNITKRKVEVIQDETI
jgi:Holliday junction resolvase